MFLQHANEFPKNKYLDTEPHKKSNMDGDIHARVEEHMGKYLGSRPQR